jgi:hypothetical protein
MKASEKILLVVTIGLGVTFGVTHLGGLGRQVKPSATAPAGQPASSAPAAPATRSTLELLASKRTALRPLPDAGRNPFRPVTTDGALKGVVLEIKVTGILGEAEPLTALISGRIVPAGDPVDGLTLLRIGPGEQAVEPLLKGVRVQDGSRIGGLTVVRVTARGVVFRYEDRTFFVELFNRAAHPTGAAGDAANLGSRKTESSNR